MRIFDLQMPLKRVIVFIVQIKT